MSFPTQENYRLKLLNFILCPKSQCRRREEGKEGEKRGVAFTVNLHEVCVVMLYYLTVELKSHGGGKEMKFC